MGTCGSEGPAFNGSRVILRSEASKRALSSLRVQARHHQSTVRGEGSQHEEDRLSNASRCTSRTRSFLLMKKLNSSSGWDMERI